MDFGAMQALFLNVRIVGIASILAHQISSLPIFVRALSQRAGTNGLFGAFAGALILRINGSTQINGHNVSPIAGC